MFAMEIETAELRLKEAGSQDPFKQPTFAPLNSMMLSAPACSMTSKAPQGSFGRH